MYLVPTYLELQRKLESKALDGLLLKKRRFCTGPYGKECEQSLLFAAEKKALDMYIGEL
jgi:hypothetical protein